MSIRIAVAVLALVWGWAAAFCRAEETKSNYAVVVSRTTLGQPEWKEVVDALSAKHKGQVIVYDRLAEARTQLARLFPRYACFVTTPAETTREFVAEVHRLTRQLDNDPYTDVIWGILTGYDAANALRIARQARPLVIRRVAAGTEIALELCEEGVWYSELEKGRLVRKQRGQKPEIQTGSVDSTRALVDALTEYKAELFVTSGHATERDWQIGFRYRNGSFRSRAGQLFGVDTEQRRHPIRSEDPKVYLAVGNCLMGHIDGPDAMALAFLNSAGVHQMVGYTVNTWFGYGGWGCLDYFVEQPGRFTLSEAFFANQQALLHKLETTFPQEARKNLPPGQYTSNGLLYDRDVVAFYGDPAWEARMKPGDLAWSQELTEKDGVYTFTVTPRLGEKSFVPINTNGSERGHRPIVALLPHRIRDARILEGGDLKAVLTDNFLLMPLPGTYEPGRVYKIVFKATRVK